MNLLVIPSQENSFFKSLFNFLTRVVYQPPVYLTPTDLIFIEPARISVEPSAPPICEREEFG